MVRVQRRRSSEGYYGLAIVGVLTSVVSVFYYLRIIVMMYMAEEEAAFEPPRLTATGLAGLAIAAAAIFYLGVLPSRVIDIAARSIETIF